MVNSQSRPKKRSCGVLLPWFAVVAVRLNASVAYKHDLAYRKAPAGVLVSGKKQDAPNRFWMNPSFRLAKTLNCGVSGVVNSCSMPLSSHRPRYGFSANPPPPLFNRTL